MFEKVKSRESKKCGDTRLQWIMVLIASTTMMSYGLETGWMSPTSKILQSDLSPTGYPLTDEELSWLGGILSFTAVFGVTLYAYIADAYGRKIGVLALAFPQMMGWAIKLGASSTSMLILSRIVSGIPAGGCFNVLPMYVREISQDDIRGATVALLLMMQCVGILVMYSMGSYLNYYTVLWISLAVSVMGTISLFFAPESPAFLVKKERMHEAARTVAQLRGLDADDKIVQNEVNSMRDDELYFKSLPKITYRTIFRKKAWRRAFVSSMLIVTAQACNGNFAIVTYAWTIMSSMGVAMSPDLLTLIVPSLMIIGSLVSIVGVEKLGRKCLGVATYATTSLAMTCLGTLLLLQAYGVNAPAWLGVVSIAIIVWSYAAGVTPAFYVVVAEIFNFQVRAKLVSIIISYAWFISSTQLFIFPPISQHWGFHVMFYIFAVINLLGGVATLVLLPETKGKSIVEIEEILGR